MIKVSPSMLACDFSKMGLEIEKITDCGADLVHMDVMDGHFVPNISFGPAVIKSMRNKSNLPFDTHLMISKPYDYIEKFANAGADIITFHLESQSDIIKTIEKIKSFGIKAGLAINPETDVTSLLPYLELIDLALVMTVHPGFGGQKFMANEMKKVEILKENITNKKLNCLIEIDGGVNLETIGTIKNYPVDIVVSGTCIFDSSDIARTIKLLKAL